MKYSHIIIITLITLTTQAQPTPIYNLAFEGAGIRGLAFCGAIQALEEQQVIAQVNNVAGTSAGAITALLLSINYKSSEIATIIGSTNFKKFNDVGLPILGGVHRLRKQYGYYKGDKFMQWLYKLVAAKTGNGYITFAQVAAQYKALHITGTSLTAQKLITFSATNYPNMPVINAVRISMSIPLYYKAVIIDSVGNILKAIPKLGHYDICIDGGMMCNYPINTYDQNQKINTHTVGFRVDNAAQILLDNAGTATLAPIMVYNFATFLNSFLVLNTEQLGRQRLTVADWERTISIADGGISPRIRKMQKFEINTLITNGYNATIRYLYKRNKY